MFLPATDASCATDARRTAREIGRSVGLDTEAQERAAIVATELVSNTVKHGGGGEIVVQTFSDAEGTGVELIALDKGPGIPDLARAMSDGYSTAGSAGTGLGSISRLAQCLRVYSRPGLGTAAMARVIGKQVPTPSRVVVCGLARPMQLGEPCGDAYAWAEADKAVSLLLADGLGHGIEAARAASRAVAIFGEQKDALPESMVSALHAGLRSTRGAAVAVARLDMLAGILSCSGVGNITGALVEGGVIRRIATENGTAGHVAGRIRTTTHAFTAAPLVLLHSDGIISRWSLDRFPGLSEAHPALVAGILMRDFSRGRDDAGIVAVRWRNA
jgi:anti-sigma regulatory factor (Ser/Thr protein kinase)